MSAVRFTRLPDLLLIYVAAWALTGAGVEVYNVGWGTGVWLGQFSPKWAGAFFLYFLFALAGLTVGWLWLRAPERLDRPLSRITAWRDRLGSLRWLLVPPVLFAPIFLLQYTSWGYILHGPYIRVILASMSVLLLGVLLTKTGGGFLDWTAGLAALSAVVGAVVFFSPLARVTDHPFSLGWSEGNRLWDYSIMFGRHLYEYPAGEPIPVYLDVGRQFIGGIPFLLPGLTIWQARLWLALVDIVPYLILGWVVFRIREKGTFWYWFLAGVWAFTFVAQGPIHPPLLLCAIVVALAWGRPLWLAVLLVAGASLFATVSRFTWVFAPAMWAVMLEFSGAMTSDQRLERNTWKRSAAVGLAGLTGGFGVHILFPKLSAWMSKFFSETGLGTVEAGAGIQDSVASSVSQGLLWYRLFPNETYPPGILIALFLAAGPLAIILIHLARSRRWLLNGLQQTALVLPLLAFLAVGLVVSTKIGGGGDLHNLDMLIIGLLFAGAIAWRNGARQWLAGLQSASAWTRLLVIVLVAFPGYWRLLSLKPISIHGDTRAVAVLADVFPLDPLPDPLPDTLPSEEDTLEALNGIRAEVERAAPLGEILFIDQRQLLTFGHVPQVPLVPEYDKKVLIDKALSGDAEYFAGFYRDLADGRFSLIISNPLNELVKTDPAEFGEENNAWVKWVSTPMLCYYEPLYTLRKVKVQILAPRQKDTSACVERLP